MKKNDIQKLHQMNLEELNKKLEELQTEVAQKNLEKKVYKLKNIKLVARLMDDIAVVKTIITQKQRQQTQA